MWKGDEERNRFDLFDDDNFPRSAPKPEGIHSSRVVAAGLAEITVADCGRHTVIYAERVGFGERARPL